MPKIIVRDEFDQIINWATFEDGERFDLAAQHEWPDGFPDFTIFILDPNGVLLNRVEDSMVGMQDGEDWTIVLRPQEPITTTLAIFSAMTGISTASWVSIALTAVSLIGSYLLRPKLPGIGAEYQWDDDSPQFFSAQSNQLRPGSRVPKIYGTMRIWPDLLSEPWVEYKGKTQTIKELYVVSEGYASLTDLKLYEEEVDDIGSSSFRTFFPDEPFPTDYPVVVSNHFVKAVELRAPNEEIIANFDFVAGTSSLDVDVVDYFIDFQVGWWLYLGGDDVSSANSNFYEVTSVAGQSIGLDPTPVDEAIDDPEKLILKLVDQISLDGGGDPILYGPFTWTPAYKWVQQDQDQILVLDHYFTNQVVTDPGFSGGSGYVVDTGEGQKWNWVAQGSVLNSFGQPISYNNRFTVAAPATPITVAANYVTWIDEGGFNPGQPESVFASSVFKVPGTINQIVFDLDFPSGLFTQSSGQTPRSRRVDVSMFHRLQGTTDPWVETVFGHSEITRTPTRQTFFLDVADGEYEVYFLRDTDAVLDTASTVTQDATRVTGLRGQQVADDLVGDTLNVTLVELTISTSDNQQVSGQRAFNLVASRHLTNYFSGSLEFEYYPEVRHILADIAINEMGYDITDIDMAALTGIQADLDAISVSTGQFHAILDQTMSAEDEMRIVCNPSRITPYRRGRHLYFNRVKAGTLPRMLINARNKIDPEQKTLNYNLGNDPTHAVVRFMDASDDYKEASQTYSIDGTPIADTSVVQEESVLGITNAVDAQRRAQFMVQKGIYERDMVEMSVTDDGILLAPGDVVAVTDHLRSERPVDGEVVEVIAGDQFRFDQVIPAGSYVVTLRNMLGDLETREAIVVGTDTDTLTIPGTNVTVEPTVGSSQVGLLYSFTPDTRADFDLYTVVSAAPSREGPVSVSALAYRDEAYASDTDTITPSTQAKKVNRYGNN